jgi:hypothetical protein
MPTRQVIKGRVKQMSQPPEFPAPLRLNSRRLAWDRFEVENYKRRLLGLELLERDPSKPIVLVTARDLEAELPYGRRTLGRRIKGREKAVSESASA